MIKAEKGHVIIAGTGSDTFNEWVAITLGMYRKFIEVMGKEDANAVFVEGLMAAVNEASKEENNE